MRPIALESNNQYGEEQFKKYLMNICEEHHMEGRALAFAFIVYDFSDYTIVKVLKDQDYLSTLDKIAGKFLTVFFINSQDSYFKTRQKEIYQDILRKTNIPPIPNKVTHHTMHAIPPQAIQPQTIQPQASPLEKSIQFLSKEFGLNETVNHPFIIFFQIKDKEIIDFFIIQLKREQIEEAFLELKKQMEFAVDAIKRVTPDNYENYQEIFNLLRNGVKDGRINHFINKNIVRKIGIGTILSFIKIISGNP